MILVREARIVRERNRERSAALVQFAERVEFEKVQGVAGTARGENERARRIRRILQRGETEKERFVLAGVHVRDAHRRRVDDGQSVSTAHARNDAAKREVLAFVVVADDGVAPVRR